MKIYLSLCCCALLLVVNSHAQAKSPSFTYVEAEFITSGDISVTDGNLSVDVDLDGFAVGGSVQLGPVILQASRFELDSDDLFAGANIEDSITTLAVGFAYSLPKTKLFGLVRARRDELSLTAGGFDEDEDIAFVGVEAGVRVNVTDWLELNANIGKPSTETGESFGVGAQLFVTKNLGITVDFNSIEAEEDDISASFDTSSVGLRYSF